MASSGKNFPFFVLTLFFFCSILVQGNEPLVTVHVSDDMPPNSEVVRVNCSGLSEMKLWAGQEFHFADARTSRFICNAIWSDKDGIWMAFEPARDAGHNDVYSSVREDGFYFGYDQSKWTKLNPWHS